MSIESRLIGLEESVKRMERRLRRWRCLSAALLVAIGLGVCAGAAADLGVVKGREFRLEDAEGKLRGCLAMRPDGSPGLAFFDKEGYLRLSLDLANDGAPGVNLHDPRGVLRQ